MSEIKSIKAREILDSKGDPTIEVDLVSDNGLFQASVPSGVSTGMHEAIELGVLQAIKNINEIIGPRLIGKDPVQQKQIDDLMIELDGTEQKSNLGANAILPVSIAVCRAGAKAENLDLWQYIFKLNEARPRPDEAEPQEEARPRNIPNPCILLIEGGLHAGNNLDVQEFMIASVASSFKEKLKIGIEIYHILKEILTKKYGKQATNIGYEGGFAPPLKRTQQALDLIMRAISRTGYKNKVKIILDVAASRFYKDGVYDFEGTRFTKQGLLNFYLDLIKKYPILGIEDPFEQEDWYAWNLLRSNLNKQERNVFLIGDDLTVTNKNRINQAIEQDCANAVVIKPNQIGTVTQTINAAKIATQANWEIFVKHRAGETNDDFIADLAVGLGAKYIMPGAPCRGERVAKYNRLLRIQEKITKNR